MNNVQFIGRPTRDIELKLSKDKQSVYASFLLAVDRPKKDKSSNQSQEQTADFPRILVFGKTAENVAKYVHQGDIIAVECHVRTSSYQNDQNVTCYTTDFIANRVQFIYLRKINKDKDANISDFQQVSEESNPEFDE